MRRRVEDSQAASRLSYPPVIRDLLVIEISNASDKGTMSLPARPVDCLALRLEGLQHMVRVILALHSPVAFPKEGGMTITITANQSENRMGKVHRLKPTRADAEMAVRTLIAWAGDDPDREGLRETPVRVTRAYEEWFVGYDQNPEQMLRRTFGEVAGYDRGW